MHQIKVYSTPGFGKISPLSIKREWMDETWNAHAYHCFPVSLANQLGWGISFPEDITFIWDGISDTSQDHVKILSGKKYVYSDRANATISFKTGLMFKTDENVTLLQMPVPNNFIDGVTPFTTLISTSFYHGDLPCAWRITKPNVEITIKANTPVISIIPIDLEKMQHSEIIIEDSANAPRSPNSATYAATLSEINKTGRWSDFYRNAVNDLGQTIGKHQLKSIKLKVLNS